MDFPLWITVIGTVASLAGMVIAIGQARSAYRSSQIASAAMTTVQLAAVAERLKSAQEHIRDMAPDKLSLRGFKSGSRVDAIRQEFDTALSALPKTGMGSTARGQLVKAQSRLNSYSSSLSTEPNNFEWQNLQSLVQDTISDLTATAIQTGEHQ